MRAVSKSLFHAAPRAFSCTAAEAGIGCGRIMMARRRGRRPMPSISLRHMQCDDGPYHARVCQQGSHGKPGSFCRKSRCRQQGIVGHDLSSFTSKLGNLSRAGLYKYALPSSTKVPLLWAKYSQCSGQIVRNPADVYSFEPLEDQVRSRFALTPSFASPMPCRLASLGVRERLWTIILARSMSARNCLKASSRPEEARPHSSAFGVSRMSALSARSDRRNSARDVNIRYGSVTPRLVRSSIITPI